MIFVAELRIFVSLQARRHKEKTHPDLKLILARFDELAAFLKKPIT